jgi:hypothetical protein
MYADDRPQVFSLDAAGDPRSAVYLGAIGNVSGLTYGYTCSGGAASMSCTLARHASYRTNAIDPARQVKVIAGASIIWDGVLDEPQPSDSGYNITARGSGTFGDDYMAIFDTWDNCPDEAIDRAIGRGLRWQNAGIGKPPGMWLGQRPDPGSLSITELLNLICARGGLTWYVSSSQGRNALSVFPLPQDPDRLLITSSPVGRTLGGDINVIWIRYQAPGPLKRFFGGNSPDITHSLKPQFHRTSVEDDDSIARYGRLETFLDLSSSGPLGTDNASALAAAQAVGQRVLDRYRRVSYAGPFTVGPGQLTNLGGTPVDLATEQGNRMVCKLVVSDLGLGGEVSPVPPRFITGAYSYSVEDLTATITPMETIVHDLAGLLAEATGQPGHGTGDWRRR